MMGKRKRKLYKYVSAVLAAVFISVLAYAFSVNSQGNFHPITPAEAYRSGQLDRDQLVRYVRLYNIRSVVNLRGRHPESRWYKEERAVCSELGLNHYNVDLSSTREPTGDEVKTLMGIFKTAPRPVLFHCMQGADRSGLVAAMWKVAVDKEPKSEAAKQLTIFYGHIPIGGTHVLDSFFEKWNPEFTP